MLQCNTIQVNDVLGGPGRSPGKKWPLTWLLRESLKEALIEIDEYCCTVTIQRYRIYDTAYIHVITMGRCMGFYS